MAAPRLWKGRGPGRNPATNHLPLRRSHGTSPAQTSDDLPLPEAPTTATNGTSATLSTSARVTSSRPKKKRASSSRKANSPR
jgi:hypothetical protein